MSFKVLYYSPVNYICELNTFDSKNPLTELRENYPNYDVIETFPFYMLVPKSSQSYKETIIFKNNCNWLKTNVSSDTESDINLFTDKYFHKINNDIWVPNTYSEQTSTSFAYRTRDYPELINSKYIMSITNDEEFLNISNKYLNENFHQFLRDNKISVKSKLIYRYVQYDKNLLIKIAENYNYPIEHALLFLHIENKPYSVEGDIQIIMTNNYDTCYSCLTEFGKKCVQKLFCFSKPTIKYSITSCTNKKLILTAPEGMVLYLTINSGIEFTGIDIGNCIKNIFQNIMYYDDSQYIVLLPKKINDDIFQKSCYFLIKDVAKIGTGTKLVSNITSSTRSNRHFIKYLENSGRAKEILEKMAFDLCGKSVSAFFVTNTELETWLETRKNTTIKLVNPPHKIVNFLFYNKEKLERYCNNLNIDVDYLLYSLCYNIYIIDSQSYKIVSTCFGDYNVSFDEKIHIFLQKDYI